jgi:hypothetical protein
MRKTALVEMSVAGMVEGRGNGGCCDLQEGGGWHGEQGGILVVVEKDGNVVTLCPVTSWRTWLPRKLEEESL